MNQADQDIVIQGLARESIAYTLILKALVEKSGLSKDEVLDSINNPHRPETSLALQDSTIRGGVRDTIKAIFGD